MLEDGFRDELTEITESLPKSRQTMLFSATMTDDVNTLIRLSLTKPVRLFVDPKNSTVTGLTQEFIRIRPEREKLRPAILLELCRSFFTNRVIIFFRSKAFAHRMRIIFGLLNLKAGELHGSLSQEQRMSALESFRMQQVDFLLCTDLASRGLDIKGIDTVINYEAPASYEIYLHRVGRTARAGRLGRAITLAGEADRKIVKTALKAVKESGKIVSRVLSPEKVDTLGKILEELEEEVEAVLKEEKEEKAMRIAEMEVRKGENVMRYQDEIMARPKRTWFASEKEKAAAKGTFSHDICADKQKNPSPCIMDFPYLRNRRIKRKRTMNPWEGPIRRPKRRGEQNCRRGRKAVKARQRRRLPPLERERGNRNLESNVPVAG
jgi:ATP-dependent RNA helicase DDX27